MTTNWLAKGSTFWRRRENGVLAATLLLGALACESNHEDVGEARLAIAQAPADVACIRVTVKSSRTVVKAPDVARGFTNQRKPAVSLK